jgi:hypothetical protein
MDCAFVCGKMTLAYVPLYSIPAAPRPPGQPSSPENPHVFPPAAPDGGRSGGDEVFLKLFSKTPTGFQNSRKYMYFQIIQQNNPMLQHVCQISSFVKTMLKTFCVLSKSLEIVQGMFWTFVDLYTYLSQIVRTRPRCFSKHVDNQHTQKTKHI